MPIDLSIAGPVNDNKYLIDKRGHSKKDSYVKHKAMDVPKHNKPSHMPVASSLPGALSIIQDVNHGIRKHEGIPGIISMTTTSPETRSRLLAGIIDMTHDGHKADGPVHAVTGHDATARNAGFRPIPGSPFR